MTIPYVPGWGDTLQQNLPQIGNNIARIINPNLDLQLAMKQHLATNPQLAQQLSDLERQAPGTLQRLGLGSMGQTISQMPMSVNQQVQNDTRQRYANDQNFRNDVQSKTALGVLPEERARTTAQANDLNANARRSTAEAAGQDIKNEDAQLQLQQHRRQSAEIEEAWRKNPNLADIDLQDAARSYWLNDKKVPTDVMTRIQSDPVAKNAWEKELELQEKSASIAAENYRTGIISASTRGEQYSLMRGAIDNKKVAMGAMNDARNDLAKYDLDKVTFNTDQPLATEMGTEGDEKGKLKAEIVDPTTGQPKYLANAQAKARTDARETAKQNAQSNLEKYQKMYDDADELYNMVMRENPKMKKEFDDYEKNKQKKATEAAAAAPQSTTKPASNTKTDTTTRQPVTGPTAIRQNYVNFAKVHIKNEGLEAVKGTAAWKAMTPAEQAAAQKP